MVAWAVSLSSARETLRVADRVASTAAEGPGCRYAIWLQGCSIRCAQCCNPHLFDPRGGESVPVTALLEEVRGLVGTIEGVTVVGGEPFDQARSLAEFLQRVRSLGLGVIVFSGFRIEELRARRDPAVAAALAATDVLVDGPYLASEPETARRWVGSHNQRFHYLTQRYDPSIEQATAEAADFTVEVVIRADGTCAIHGWPEPFGVADR